MKAKHREEVIRQCPDTNSNECFETLYNCYVTEVYSRYLSPTSDTGKAQGFAHDMSIRPCPHGH